MFNPNNVQEVDIHPKVIKETIKEIEQVNKQEYKNGNGQENDIMGGMSKNGKLTLIIVLIVILMVIIICVIFIMIYKD